MNTKRSRLPVLFWLLAFTQGLLFNISTPLWEGFDEPFHYSYIQALAERRELPIYGRSLLSKEVTTSFENAPLSYAANSNLGNRYTTFGSYWSLSDKERLARHRSLTTIPTEARLIADTGESATFNYEAHHAPLYYVLSAFVYRAFSSCDLLTRVFVLRLFSMAIGSLTVVLAFTVAKRVFTETRQIHSVPLLIAILPMFCSTVGRISNDSLAVPLYTLLVLSVLTYSANSPTTGHAIRVGIVLGFGLLTKVYFLAAVPTVIAVFGLSAVFQSRKKHLLGHLLLIVAVATVLAGWWYVRNYVLYGNISGMQEITLTSTLTPSDRLRHLSDAPLWESFTAMLRHHIWGGATVS